MGKDYIERLEVSLVKAIELPEPKKDEEVVATYSEAKGCVDERETARAMEIEMKEVKSSNIKSIGYSRKHKQFRINFINGGLFQYKDVPEETFNELSKAESVGSFFSKNIRNNFKCIKL